MATPTSVVEEYLAAIAAGDVEQAMELDAQAEFTSSAGYGEPTDARTDAAFEGATTIDDAHVTDMHEEDGHAWVWVTYTLAGETIEDHVSLDQIDGAWTITGSLARTVLLDRYGPVETFELQIGEEPVERGASSLSVVLYPAEYVVTRAGSDYLEPYESTFVLGSDTYSLAIEDEPTAAVLDAVNAQIADFAAGCEDALGDSYNNACSVSPTDFAIAFDPVAWSIAELPQLDAVELGSTNVTLVLEAAYDGADAPDAQGTPHIERVDASVDVQVWLSTPDDLQIEVAAGL